MLRKPDNNWVSKHENKIVPFKMSFVCCSCIMMTNQKKRSALRSREESDRKFGLGLWDSLDFEIERYQLKSSLEFEIMA